MKRYQSGIRLPNRRERRAAFRTSSLARWMTWGIFHRTKLKAVRDNLFRPNPLFTWAAKGDSQ